MYSSTFVIALFLSLVATVFAAELSINTPQAVASCKEVTITWQSGKAPYTLSVVPGDDPCEDTLVDLGSTNDTWFSWKAPSLKAGTKIIIALEDSTDEEVWSTELTVQNGTDSSCLTAASGTAAVDTPRTGTIVNVAPTPASSGSSSSSSNSNSNSPANVGAISAATSLSVSVATIATVVLLTLGVAVGL